MILDLDPLPEGRDTPPISMKTFPIAVLALAFVVPALSGSARASIQSYLQVSAIYADIDGDFKSGPGLTVAGGVAFTKHNSIEAEVISFNTQTKDFNPSYDNKIKTKIQFTPILLTYRYTFPVNDQFGAFAGFSVGRTYARYEKSYAWNSTHWSQSGTDSVNSGGPQIGCTYNFSPHSSITAALRALYIDQTDATTISRLYIFQLGYRFTF